MTGFWRGFRAITPLWLGMMPFGAAYAVSARAAGLSPFETQLMSLAVFAGGAQFGAAGLFAAGASPFTLVATTFLINARHLLYGVSLGQAVRFGPRERLLAAHLLTDEAYGVTFGSPVRSAGFFLGAGSSVFFVWNLSTLLGSLLSALVPDPAALGVDFIFPLAFLALLVPLLKGWPALVVAVFAGVFALFASRVLNGGLVVLFAGVLGPFLGAYLTRGKT